VHGVTNDPHTAGVSAQNTGAGIGVYAGSNSGYALFVDGPTTQRMNQDGMVKALIRVRFDNNQGRYAITRCFNSQLPGNIISQPPCGITLTNPAAGNFYLDMHYDVSSRFVTAMPSLDVSLFADTLKNANLIEPQSDPRYGLPNNVIGIAIFYAGDGNKSPGTLTNGDFDVVVY